MAAKQETDEQSKVVELRVIQPTKKQDPFPNWFAVAFLLLIFFLGVSPQWFTDFLDRTFHFLFGR